MTAILIYALSLDGLEHRYVGLTTQGASSRLWGHRWEAKNGDKIWPVYQWMRKHGPENVRITILEGCVREALVEKERHWIGKLRNLGYPLLNCSDGGEGSGTGKTKETIKNYSAGAKRRYSNPEERRKQSVRSKEVYSRPEVRAALSSAAKQQWSTPEARAAQSARAKADWVRRKAKKEQADE